MHTPYEDERGWVVGMVGGYWMVRMVGRWVVRMGWLGGAHGGQGGDAPLQVDVPGVGCEQVWLVLSERLHAVDTLTMQHGARKGSLWLCL
jgi:hypothetical protein